MTRIYKDIFKAIHEGRWLEIEYKNVAQDITRYWIGIKKIDIQSGILLVDGLRLGSHLALKELTVKINAILSSFVLEGTYYPINKRLCADISENPEKYQCLFNNTANLKILNYLDECHKLDATPYKCDYELIEHIDQDTVPKTGFVLSNQQFEQIVNHFQQRRDDKNGPIKLKQLCMNITSIHTSKGLYVLAYRRLEVDIKNRMLRPAEEITVCREFYIDGQRTSIQQFLDADELSLIDDFEKNQERIKDLITTNNPHLKGVDDMPYLIAIGFDILVNLQLEYKCILDMYDNDNVSEPIRAFFGELIKRPMRRKEYPIALLNNRVNLDQLLAINHAMKYPLSYVQGPPGTGKTNTIINTIITAFFNERTVLFASYNNHPVNSIFNEFRKLSHKGKQIPFPVIRLGSNKKIEIAMKDIQMLYEMAGNLTIYDGTLNKNRDTKIKRTAKLTELLRRYEQIVDLQERKEAIETLLQSEHHLTLQIQLQNQLSAVIKQLSDMEYISNEDALALVVNDTEEFEKYLFYTSASYVKRLDEPKNEELLKIIQMSDVDEQKKAFNKFARNEENLKKLLRIFPIVLTTCLSAHKLGEGKPVFDMVIIDEAGQCNTATSLLPIVRGESLMLVGDPQQLNPVVLLSPENNLILRNRYQVTDEYDYICNSVYKTFIACDAVSDEVLLSYHYRCHPQIIQFNNKKYYNNRLKIMSQVESEHPLIFAEICSDEPEFRNTSPLEAGYIIDYIRQHPDQQIGIITPFVAQKKLINELIIKEKIENIICGTVHAFQGDEKDVILFSLVLTSRTSSSTYNWLKGNKELINVATSRAKAQLVLIADSRQIERLRNPMDDDDLYELVQYIKTNGESAISSKVVVSRALGIKPYSTETENAFLQNLSHAIVNIMPERRRYVVQHEVAISHVFAQNISGLDLFYSGRFDFVVYERHNKSNQVPVLAIELDGKEHFDNEIVKRRDQKKATICEKHGFELIRIENSYARRYQHIKEILIEYFKRI